jgi:hypothetical protein
MITGQGAPQLQQLILLLTLRNATTLVYTPDHYQTKPYFRRLSRDALRISCLVRIRFFTRLARACIHARARHIHGFVLLSCFQSTTYVLPYIRVAEAHEAPRASNHERACAAAAASLSSSGGKGAGSSSGRRSSVSRTKIAISGTDTSSIRTSMLPVLTRQDEPQNGG